MSNKVVSELSSFESFHLVHRIFIFQHVCFVVLVWNDISDSMRVLLDKFAHEEGEGLFHVYIDKHEANAKTHLHND